MKKLILMLLMAECCLMTAHAQKTVVSQTNQKVFDTVEQMPEYPGGMQAMIAFLQTNMKYPEDAAKQKVEGRVMVQFIVETTPGKEKGNVVRVKYNLPIVFRM